MIVLLSEYHEFRYAHRNRWNQLFHALCGLLYVPCFLLVFPSFSEKALVGYLLFLWSTLIYSLPLFIPIPIPALLLTSLLLPPLLSLLHYLSFSAPTLLLLGSTFYLLPEASHLLTNEHTAVTLENLTPLKVVINILYLPLFSIMTLLDPCDTISPPIKEHTP